MVDESTVLSGFSAAVKLPSRVMILPSASTGAVTEMRGSWRRRCEVAWGSKIYVERGVVRQKGEVGDGKRKKEEEGGRGEGD